MKTAFTKCADGYDGKYSLHFDRQTFDMVNITEAVYKYCAYE